MFTIQSPITLDAAAISSPNLCDRFDPTDLSNIGVECWAGYERDRISRETWMRRNEAGMDLALQISKDKNFPWPGCSNIAFPLITIAAQQFHARAYPAIVDGPDIVKCRVTELDETGELTARADRISTHMSWQVLEQDKAWEEQMDKLLLNLSIVGTSFKKTYFSAAKSHNVSELVLAKDLVIDYWAKCVDEAPRKTHLQPMFRNEIYERVMRGTYRDILEEQWYQGAPANSTSTTQVNQNNRQGVTPPPPDDTTSFLFLEQCCRMDLDGDGYFEPYIITFDSISKEVVRIVCNFESDADVERVMEGKYKGKILRIFETQYYTKFSFIPSPDGGIYDIGFGVFLGPLNEAVNSLVNQLVDAGSMANGKGGFLGRGAKIRGGVYTFSPFEWKRVDSNGDDLRKNIVPLEGGEPSMVLFNLLSLLIDYTNRIAGSTDLMVGENPGQNTPAETSRLMAEMGQKIYNAIFKRVWRATKEEFEKLYTLNSRHILPGKRYIGGATSDDYLGNPDEIAPAADPNITSDSMALQQATALKQAAMTTPGYDRDAVEMRYLKALKIDAPAQVFPGTKGAPPPEDVKVQLQKLKNEVSMAELEWSKQEFVLTLQEERQLNGAKITELMASAEKLAADAQSEQAYAQVAIINAQVAGLKTKNEQINSRIDHLLRAAELEIKKDAAGAKVTEKVAA